MTTIKLARLCLSFCGQFKVGMEQRIGIFSDTCFPGSAKVVPSSLTGWMLPFGTINGLMGNGAGLGRQFNQHTLGEERDGARRIAFTHQGQICCSCGPPLIE